MNQEKESTLVNNTHTEPFKEIISEINQDVQDVNSALVTNAALVKKSVRQARFNQFKEFKNDVVSELKDIPHEILEAKKWNGLKTNTIGTIEIIRTKTMDEIKDTNKNLNKAGRSAFTKSSKLILQSKDFLSKNAPKVSKTMSDSVNSLFKKNQSLNQKDLDLLERLAGLKESGIISQKEFNSKKKKILEKI